MKTFCSFAECRSQLGAKFLQLLGEDWLLLAMMGIVMGIFSFVLDVSIQKLRSRKSRSYYFFKIKIIRSWFQCIFIYSMRRLWSIHCSNILFGWLLH